MVDRSATAEVNIHLRARTQDRELIDRAADLVGTNRSQFMIASAVKEAKNLLLDQTSIEADARAFQQIMNWLDGAPSAEEDAGLRRLANVRAPWSRE
jgi:uncharacterized protein (DUF1778 family)